MNGFRRRGVFALAFVACVASLAPLCRAQSKKTAPPPGVPASLWVPDRFERAVRSEYPEVRYLMATVVNDATGESRRVCIEGSRLLYVIGTENDLPFTEGAATQQNVADRATVFSLLLSNRARVYHFKNPGAWLGVQPSYPPGMLDRTREQFRGVSTEEIARRFNAKNHLDGDEANALIKSAHIADGDGLLYFDTLARVFSERGLYVGRHIVFGRPYVITAAELAKQDKEQREGAEQERQAEVARQRTAARLRGYAAVTKQFVITQAYKNTHPQKIFGRPPHIEFTLKPIRPGIFDVVHWFDPLTRNNKPRYDWKQFTEVAGHLERLARLHPWLKTWKEGNPIRSVQLVLTGKKTLDDTETVAHATWKAAGLVGEPYCKVVLWEDDDDMWGAADVYLPPPAMTTTDETRGLIAYSRLLPYPSKTSGDWLRGLDLRPDSKASVRQCVVVTPTGEWNLITLKKAQAPPPTGVPISLWIPDRFERAVKNQSTAPSYLIVTVVNDATGETKRVCLEGPQLFEAVRIENNLGRGWGGSREKWDKAMRLILDNPTRTYHFKNADAWKIVQTSDAPDYLAMVRDEVKNQSAEALARRFDGKHSPGGFFTGDLRPGNMAAYSAAFAYVLTERGLYVGRGDAGNSLYVITPRMLADEAKERQAIETNWQKGKDAGKRLATRLPGYTKLQKTFRVTDANLLGTEHGYCLTVDVETKTPRVVDSFYWLDPVDKTGTKARYDWNRFLPNAAHIERLARRQLWLQTWKRSSPNRSIEARPFGLDLHSENEKTVREDVAPAWKDAGLRGVPYGEIILHWHENDTSGSATVYLPLPSSSETRALIVSGSPPRRATGPGHHWLDRLYFQSWATADPRECVVVSPGGQWKRIKLPLRTPLRP